MFGIGKPKKEETLTSMMKPENSPSKGGGGNVTGFDPEGLERAAKAARELDSSRNASAAIELIKTQEATKQHEAASKRAEMDAYTQQIKAQNIEREAEEARKTLEAQSQHDRHRAEYRDELERKRQVDMLQAQKYMQEEQLKKQEEMVARQEAMRRKTAELEAELRTKAELAKTRAETEGKIRQERENHDLIVDKLRLEAKEYRETVMKAVDDSLTRIGEGLSLYLDDKDKLRNTTFTISAIALGIYTAKVGTNIMGRFVEARFGKPSLVRETSRLNAGQFVRQPFSTFRHIFGLSNAEDAMSGIVLESSLDKQLRRVAVATANTKKNRAPFRHLLLYGPPGTGKTMFAKGLAKQSGLEYAIMTGGDVAPLGRNAVTELHKLFDWAKTSRKGLLLFVDESDAFLQSRATTRMSEDQRNALNAFLYRTGTETDKFMMVYASNQPSQFDEAITDRIDEMVEFGLPGEDERRRMVSMYIETYLLNPPGRWAKKVIMEDIGDAEIERVVRETEGFSGRAISKLAIAWQATAYGSANAVLDRDAFFDTLERFKDSLQMKKKWHDGALSRARLLTNDA